MNKGCYIIGSLLLLLLSGYGYWYYTTPPTKENQAPVQSSVTIQVPPANLPDGSTLKTSYCPNVSELQKENFLWNSVDHRWKNYTPSSASKVLNFTGAQWIGVKIGKVICLYQTDEAVAFPLAMEQINNQSIVEPQNGGWSALVDNHKFCQSTNTHDCPYQIAEQQATQDIYQEISYAPRAN